MDGSVVCGLCGFQQRAVADFCFVGGEERCHGKMDKEELMKHVLCSNVMCSQHVDPSIPNSVGSVAFSMIL